MAFTWIHRRRFASDLLDLRAGRVQQGACAEAGKPSQSARSSVCGLLQFFFCFSLTFCYGILVLDAWGSRGPDRLLLEWFGCLGTAACFCCGRAECKWTFGACFLDGTSIPTVTRSAVGRFLEASFRGLLPVSPLVVGIGVRISVSRCDAFGPILTCLVLAGRCFKGTMRNSASSRPWL